MNPEPIAEALFDLVKDVSPVRHATRYRLTTKNLPEYPACILGFKGAVASPSHTRPTEWRLYFEIQFLARADGSEDSPESLINEWLENLQVALSPVGERVQTLGGLCDHCWIDGEVGWVPPDVSDPSMAAWVTVEVLAY